MQTELTNLASVITSIFNRSIVDYGCNSDVTTLLAHAHSLVRDASLIAATPGLTRVQCMNINSGIHAIKPGAHLETVCGARFSLFESVMFEYRVPTCSACVAALTAEKVPTHEHI